MLFRFFVILILFVSCKTYTISKESLTEQLSGVDKEKMNEVEVSNPLLFGNIRYSANNIQEIIVLDKEGNQFFLKNSPSLEMRVTQKNGKKNVLYFDTVVIEGEILKGSRSRFSQALTIEIPIVDILKIEIQDGRKNFKYKK